MPTRNDFRQAMLSPSASGRPGWPQFGYCQIKTRRRPSGTGSGGGFPWSGAGLNPDRLLFSSYSRSHLGRPVHPALVVQERRGTLRRNREQGLRYGEIMKEYPHPGGTLHEEGQATKWSIPPPSSSMETVHPAARLARGASPVTRPPRRVGERISK